MKGGIPLPPCRSTARLLVHEMSAAVLLPARLGTLCAERFFLAVADGADTVAGNAQLHQSLFGCVRPVVAERQVVLGGAALVAVPLDCELDIGVLLQKAGVRLQCLLILWLDVVAVVGEEDILHVLREQLRFTLVRGLHWRRSWSLNHGHTCGSLLGSYGVLCNKVIRR